MLIKIEFSRKFYWGAAFSVDAVMWEVQHDELLENMPALCFLGFYAIERDLNAFSFTNINCGGQS